MFKEKLEQWKECYLTGDITLSKVDFLLIAMVCLLTGILFGIMKVLWMQKAALRSGKGCHICKKTTEEETE